MLALEARVVKGRASREGMDEGVRCDQSKMAAVGELAPRKRGELAVGKRKKKDGSDYKRQ